jgi:hypothetical protein
LLNRTSILSWNSGCHLFLPTVWWPESREISRGPAVKLSGGIYEDLTWTVEDLGGAPIANVGIELATEKRVSGTVYLDYLDWRGVPKTTFRRLDGSGQMWLRAWVNDIDQVDTRWPEAFHLSQSRGTGLLIMGGRDWQDYAVAATIAPRLALSFGLAARVRGLSRYYAFLLSTDGTARLVKRFGKTKVLAEVEFRWEFEQQYELRFSAFNSRITGWVGRKEILSIEDDSEPLSDGGFAFVCEEGLTNHQ